MVPLELDSRSRSNSQHLGSRSVSSNVASKIRAADVGDGVVVWGLPDGSLLVVDVLEGGMSRDERAAESSREESSRELHFECDRSVIDSEAVGGERLEYGGNSGFIYQFPRPLPWPAS